MSVKISGLTSGMNNNPVAGNASAYKKNIQNQQRKMEEELNPVQITGRDVLGKIGNVAKTDPNRANDLFSQYQKFSADPTSPIWKPYTNATNPAVKALAELGFDANGLDREWFNNNTEWKNYLVYGDKTNTPKDPGKKATQQQKVAYYLNQYASGLDTTEAMDSEWAAMQDEIKYWAGRADLNLSPDQIVDKVTKSMKSKYPTLYKMDQSMQPGASLIELNHGSDYSRDGMYGAVWAAMNNGGTGNNLMDTVMSGMGEGNVWKPNDAITAALDRNNPDTYAPYSVGMTLEDEGAYFGVPYFTDENLAEIQKGLDYDNPTEVKMYNNAFSAHQKTKEAKSQLDSLVNDIDRWINMGYNEEKILNKLDKALDDPDYNILRQMDDSILNGTDLVKTTQAIDYRKADMVQRIKDVVAIRDGRKDASQMMQDMGLPGYSEGQQDVNDIMSQRAAMIADSIWGIMSPAEQNYFKNSPKLNGKQITETLYKAKQGLLGPIDQNIDAQWVADMSTKQAKNAERTTSAPASALFLSGRSMTRPVRKRKASSRRSMISMRSMVLSFCPAKKCRKRSVLFWMRRPVSLLFIPWSMTAKANLFTNWTKRRILLCGKTTQQGTLCMRRKWMMTSSRNMFRGSVIV